MVNLHDRSEIKWCSVNLSDVFSRGKRLEASVFDVEAKRARQIIFKGKFPVAYIGGENGLTTSYTCARFKRIWLEKSDLPIYQPSSIVDIKPIPDGYISKLTRTNIEKLIGSGAYSIDDVREAAGMQPINEDWSTKHFLTLNISTIEKAAQAAEGNITEGGE